jgi:hypothetical protein
MEKVKCELCHAEFRFFHQCKKYIDEEKTPRPKFDRDYFLNLIKDQNEK